MALGIPLPGQPGDALLKGMESGGNMFTRIMNPILERERQKQLEEHFKQEMALRKAQFARSGANSDLTRQVLQQQLLGLQHKNDPNYEFQQFQALQNMIMGNGNPQGAPQQPMQPQPTQEMGEGMGMFSPEGLDQAQQAPVPQQPPIGQPNAGGMNLNALMQNPMLRGFFKHKFGFDPLAMPQTPEDKQAAAIDLFKQKEALKAQNKGGDTPTNTVLTQNQQAIQGIDTVVPMIDELLESKDIPGIMDFSPGKKAAYNAKTSSMIDTLIAAQSLPKVQASIDLVEEQIRRKTGETTADYKKRLQSLRDDLMGRRARSQSVVQTRKVNTSEMPAQEKSIGGKKYKKIDGEWHEVD